MDTYRRTQVYLTPQDHGELRRVAAERGVSMTTVVREAVGRYLVDAEADRGGPQWDEPDYERLGIPAGSAGLAARMRARSAASSPPALPGAGLSAEDRDIGEHLYREYVAQRAEAAAWRDDAPR